MLRIRLPTLPLSAALDQRSHNQLGFNANRPIRNTISPSLVVRSPLRKQLPSLNKAKNLCCGRETNRFCSSVPMDCVAERRLIPGRLPPAGNATYARHHLQQSATSRCRWSGQNRNHCRARQRSTPATANRHLCQKRAMVGATQCRATIHESSI